MGCFSSDLWDVPNLRISDSPCCVYIALVWSEGSHQGVSDCEQTEGFLGRPVVRMNGSSVFILFLLWCCGFFPVGFNSSFKAAHWGSPSVGILCDDCIVCPCCCNVCLITRGAALPLLNERHDVLHWPLQGWFSRLWLWSIETDLESVLFSMLVFCEVFYKIWTASRLTATFNIHID